MKISLRSFFLRVVFIALLVPIPVAVYAQNYSYSSPQVYSCDSYYSYSPCFIYTHDNYSPYSSYPHSSNNSSYKTSQPSYVQVTYILSTDSYYYPGYGEYPYLASSI